MTVHRLTGRKEISLFLHKMINTISYNDGRLQNKFWFNMLMSKPQISKRMVKHLPTHVTIDNNDRHKETTPGKGTTHYTNQIMFQPLLKVMCFDLLTEVDLGLLQYLGLSSLSLAIVNVFL